MTGLSMTQIVSLVGMAALLAGAIWRLGSRLGEIGDQLTALRAADRDRGADVDNLRSQVDGIDRRLTTIEARCSERRDITGRWMLQDGRSVRVRPGKCTDAPEPMDECPLTPRDDGEGGSR